MTVETRDESDEVPPDDRHGARAAAWEEHRRRCGDNEPNADGVTVEALAERVDRLCVLGHSAPTITQDYALAVSSGEGPTSDDISTRDESSNAERELSWVAVLPEGDRRMFAEEMSQLLAEAAETDDLAAVQQALWEWRATAEIHADPVLARRLSGPLVANGARVPRPVV